MNGPGTFRDVHGREVRLPSPSHEDQEAIAEFRSQLNGQLAPEAVLERIRRHTALIAAMRRGPDGIGLATFPNSTPPKCCGYWVDTESTTF